MRIQILCLAILPLAGWAGENSSLAMATTSSMVRPETSRFDVVDAIRRMESRNDALRNLAIEAEIKVSRAGKEDVSLSGQYYASGSDYRFKMSWGMFDVIDLSAKGNEVVMWLPRKGVYCIGSRSLLAETPNDLRVLGMVFDARGLLSPDCWMSGADRRTLIATRDGAIVTVFGSGTILRRYVLARMDDDLVVQKVVLFDGGKPVAAIRHSGHERNGDVILPSRVDVHPSESTIMSFVIKKMRPNSAKEPSVRASIPEEKLSEGPAALGRALAAPSLFE